MFSIPVVMVRLLQRPGRGLGGRPARISGLVGKDSYSNPIPPDVVLNYNIDTIYVNKKQKTRAEMMPGEFIRKGGSVPRRIITESEFESLLEHSDTDFL